MKEERFYIIPHSDQWFREFEGELPAEVTVIDRTTNCPVHLMDRIWLECLPYNVGVSMVDNLNWLESQIIEEEKFDG